MSKEFKPKAPKPKERFSKTTDVGMALRKKLPEDVRDLKANSEKAKKGKEAVVKRAEKKKETTKKTLSKLPTKAQRKAIKEWKDRGVKVTAKDLNEKGQLKKGTEAYKKAMALLTDFKGKEKKAEAPKPNKAQAKAIKEWKGRGVNISVADLNSKGQLKKGTPGYKKAMATLTNFDV